MSILHKVCTALKVLKKDGLHGIVSILRPKYYGLPIFKSQKSKWAAEINSEIAFWDNYLHTTGLQMANDSQGRFDPDLPLQPRVAALLPPKTEIQILDVGSGPLTFLGKKSEGKRINITAVDPLANEYDRILNKYQIQPIVRTQKLAAEELSKRFPVNTFDLVFARNCIDHAYDPEKAVLQLIAVVKERPVCFA